MARTLRRQRLHLDRAVLSLLTSLIQSLRTVYLRWGRGYEERWAALGLAVLLLAWNWKLVLALALGVGAAIAIFRGQGDRFQLWWRKWQTRTSTSNRHFAVAAGGGSFTALGAYLCTSVWAQAENRWLAVATIVQTLATVATLSLVAWQMGDRASTNAADPQVLLADLADPRPLKRLVAVRQLSRLLQEETLDKQQQQTVGDCFELMLGSETEPTVRNALLDGWQIQGDRRSLRSNSEFRIQSSKLRPLSKVQGLD